MKALTLRDLFLMDNNKFIAEIDEKFIRLKEWKDVLEALENGDEILIVKKGLSK